jgi:hypothetical protein
MNHFDLVIKLEEVKRANKEELMVMLEEIVNYTKLDVNEIILLRAAHKKMLTKFNFRYNRSSILLSMPDDHYRFNAKRITKCY